MLVKEECQQLIARFDERFDKIKEYFNKRYCLWYENEQIIKGSHDWGAVPEDWVVKASVKEDPTNVSLLSEDLHIEDIPIEDSMMEDDLKINTDHKGDSLELMPKATCQDEHLVI